jgi:hypothetical protein
VAAFAEGTTVPVENSKAEIEKMLTRFGADQFMSGWDGTRAIIGFRFSQRFIRFELNTMSASDPRMATAGKKQRTPAQRQSAADAENRRLWRAMCLVIKSKLEAVTSKIESFEIAFMPYISMPDGKPFHQHALPAIGAAYENGKMQPLLPDYSGRKGQ